MPQPRWRGIAKWSAVGIAFTAAIVLALMWLAGSFQDKIDPEATTSQALERRTLAQGWVTAPVRLQTRPREEEAIGTVRPVHESAVASRILAEVKDVHARAGQRVTVGDLLVQLDDADLNARLRQSAAALDSAQATLDQAVLDRERAQGLLAEQVISQAEFDRADTAWRTAQAGLEQATRVEDEARNALSHSAIRSPLSGVVIDRRVEPGDMVVPGQTLVSLYDPDHMQLVASVRESLTRLLAVDQPLPVTIDALDLRCEGRIAEIVPEAEARTRSFQVKVTGPCPPGVYAGMFGRLHIPVGDEQVLLVPTAAVRRVGQLRLVEVVEDGHLQRRAVQLGRTLDDDQEILAGLQEGETVAFDPNTAR